MLDLRENQGQVFNEVVKLENDYETAKAIVYGDDGSAKRQHNASRSKSAMHRSENNSDPENSKQTMMTCQCSCGMDEKLAEYEIIPIETYKILRNCSGCGSKTVYRSTNKVRVNANGKQIDVWLIYQCTKCKHPYNLPILSRIHKNRLNKAEYEAFLRNDQEIVYKYGLNRVLFQRNNVSIFEEPAYVLRGTGKDTEVNTIKFRNPYNLRIRYDKLIAECLKISRSEAKRALENGVISIEQPSDNEVIFNIDVCYYQKTNRDTPICQLPDKNFEVYQLIFTYHTLPSRIFR